MGATRFARFGRLGLGFLGTMLLVGLAGPARATSTCSLAGASTWNLGTSGVWSAGGNWNPLGVPNSAATNVCIVDGTSTVTLDSSFTIGSLQLAAGNGLSFGTNTTLTVNGPQAINAGTITVNGGNSYNNYLNISSNTTLSGGGTVTLTSLGGGGTSIVQQYGGSITLTNQDNTIQGSGIIGNGGLAFVNNATVDANSSGQTLTLNGSSGVTNTATLEATGGGTLAINTGVTNTGGTITAAAGSTVNISNAISGGTLTSTGTGLLQSAGTGTLNSATISTGSTYTTATNNTTVLNTSLVNQGTLALNGGGGTNSTLNIASNTTLSGGGAVTMSVAGGGGTSIIQQYGGSITLTNLDNTIQGTGVIGNGGLTFVNDAAGTVNANATGATLSLNGSGNVTNLGTLEASNTGTLQIFNTVNNAGGAITANNGTVSLTGGATVQAGTLTATAGGVIETAGGNSATLDGRSVANGGQGTLNIVGGYVGQVNSTTNVMGAINNTGTITLNGGSGYSALLNIASDTTLSGGGTMTLNSLAGGNTSIVQQYGGSFTLTNQGNTIQGTGIIGNNGLSFVNNATVDANSAGQTLTLDGSGAMTNTATLEATGGGTLAINTGVTNTGGTITAAAGSTVNISNAISGGTLTSTGTGLLQSAGTGTLNSATISTGSTYTTATNNTTVLNTSLVNQGTLALNGGSGTNSILNIASNTTLSGGGAVTMSVAGGGGTSIIQQYGGSITLTNLDNTIQGTGVIGSGSLTFVNDAAGTVNANAAGATLVLNGSGNVTNLGTLEASNTGTLQIFNTVNNAGGAITANNGTVSLMGGATVQAGTLTATAGGVIETAASNSAALDGRSIANGGQGTLNIVGGYVGQVNSTTNVMGAINNTGTITLNGGGGYTANLNIASDTTLSGGGTVTLNVAGGGGTSIVQQSASATLTNQDNTIQGAGIIGNGSLTFVNNATVDANSAGQTLTLNGSSGVTNTATLEATGGGTLAINTGVTNTGGTITAAAGSTVNNSSTISGGTLTSTGSGLLQSAGTGTLNSATISTGSTYTTATNNTTVLNTSLVNQGTLALNGGSGTNSTLNIASNTTLSGGGAVTMSGAGGGGTSIVQQYGGSITLTNLDNTIQGTGIIGNGGLTFVNDTAGTVNANAGTLTLNGSGTVTNNGTFIASDASTLSVTSALTNFAAGTLTGGTWKAVDAGNGATLALSSGPIVTDAANITVSGAASSFTANGTALETSLTTIDTAGALHVLNNRNYTTRNDIATNGLLDLGGGTFTANSQTIGSTGTLSGFGTVTNTNGSQLANAGQVIATGGVLTVSQGLSGPTGNATSNSGATLDLSSATTGSTVGTLANNGTLALGSQNVTVSTDYTNANFGTGNSFNKRANVTGTGQILAAGTPGQTLTLNGATAVTGATGTMTFHNVHVGSSATQTYTVNNIGTGGPALRGAIQTSVNGGNITSAALSGTGVTAGNFGPIAQGSATGTLAVTYAPTAAGALSGQAVHVANNFNNVGEQTLAITGAAYDLANPTVAPSPIAFGNHHVGDVITQQALTVSNNTVSNAAFQEGLDASVSGTTGGVITNNGSFSNLAAGTSNASAIKVGIDTSTAGSKNGTATLALASNGTIDGLTITSLAAKSVNVTGAVYNLASSNAIAAVSFGVLHTGSGTISKALTITNTAPTGSFSEGLNSSFGTYTNSAGTLNPTFAGTITNLAAGSTDNSSMTVSINTATAGTVSGTVAVDQASNGSIDGLGNTALSTQNVGVSGTVNATITNLAAPQINNAPIAFGNVRVGTVITSQGVSVTNAAPVSTFSEGLIASTAGQTPTGGVTESGGFGSVGSGLAGGATNATGIQVGINTATAGNKSGNAVVAFQSDGTPFGGVVSDLGTTNVAVTGNVYRVATPTLNTGSVNLAARVGDTAPTAALSITNTSPDTFTESAKASFGTVATGFTGNGSISAAPLAAQATDTTSMAVGLNTATAGHFTGTAGVNFTSTGAGTDNAADIGAGSGSVALTGNVYAQAVANVTTTTVNFGVVHVGDSVTPGAIAVTNSAASVALNDTLVGGVGSITQSGGAFSAGAPIAVGGLGAGASGSAGVALNTGTSGSFTGTANLALASHDSQLTDLALSTSGVALAATVDNYAVAGFVKTSGAGSFGGASGAYTLSLGNLIQGSGAVAASLGGGNVAGGLADLLSGSLGISSGGGFTLGGLGTFSGLGAGQVSGLSLNFDPLTLGLLTETISLTGSGSNASGYNAAVGAATLTITADVLASGPVPAPEPGSLPILAGGIAALAFATRWRRLRAGRGA